MPSVTPQPAHTVALSALSVSQASHTSPRVIARRNLREFQWDVNAASAEERGGAGVVDAAGGVDRAEDVVAQEQVELAAQVGVEQVGPVGVDGVADAGAIEAGEDLAELGQVGDGARA